jgi:peptidyl-prolyl cis-trans isomerase B (cyclophilin B)
MQRFQTLLIVLFGIHNHNHNNHNNHNNNAFSFTFPHPPRRPRGTYVPPSMHHPNHEDPLGREVSLISRRDLWKCMGSSSGSSTTTTTAVAVTLALSSFGGCFTPLPATAAYIDPVISPPIITNKVYMDIEYVVPTAGDTNTKQTGRLIIGLYGQTMPKTVQNFVTLCQSQAYAGTNFYRIISEYSIQGGAVGDVSKSGKSGQSSLEGGVPFEPDNFTIKHSTKGLVSMVKATSGSSSGGVDSRFFIQLQDDAGWADDRYAAFGIVLEGMDLVDTLKTLPVQPPKNNPKQEVNIVGCGVLL